MRLRLPSLRHEHDAEILRLAVPAFGALVAEPLFLLADAAIVGHLGTLQLAGLGIAATVVQTVVSLCIFLAYGTTAAVARRMGAGDATGALRLGRELLTALEYAHSRCTADGQPLGLIHRDVSPANILISA